MLVQDKAAETMLGEIIASLDEQPLPLGTVAEAVIRMTTDPEVSAKDLAMAISGDPGLAGKLIKRANSAFYSGSERITTVPQAIVRIGFPGTRALAVAGSVHALFRSGDAEGFEQRLWRHSLAVATGARVLIRHIRPALDEEVYLGGLLHDIAKLILLQRFSSAYQPVLRRAQESDANELDIESTMLGFTHADLGAMILERWKFGPEQIEAVRFHHQPERATAHGEDGGSQDIITHLAHAICLANLMAKALEHVSDGDRKSALVHTPSARFFGLSSEEILSSCDRLETGLEEELSIFGVSQLRSV
jgi:putative nucleotidyltransferase with HDIG domain